MGISEGDVPLSVKAQEYMSKVDDIIAKGDNLSILADEDAVRDFLNSMSQDEIEAYGELKVARRI